MNLFELFFAWANYINPMQQVKIETFLPLEENMSLLVYTFFALIVVHRAKRQEDNVIVALKEIHNFGSLS